MTESRRCAPLSCCAGCTGSASACPRAPHFSPCPAPSFATAGFHPRHSTVRPLLPFIFSFPLPSSCITLLLPMTIFSSSSRGWSADLLLFSLSCRRRVEQLVNLHYVTYQFFGSIEPSVGPALLLAPERAGCRTVPFPCHRPKIEYNSINKPIILLRNSLLVLTLIVRGLIALVE